MPVTFQHSQPALPASSIGTLILDPEHPFIPSAYQMLRRDRPLTRRSMRKNPRVVQLVGTLGAGGAERQLVNLCVGLKARNFDVSVLTSETLEGNNAFHHSTLTRHGIPARSIPRVASFPNLSHVSNAAELIAQIPNWLRPWPLQIVEELLRNPPDILHIWLDHTNIAGAISALIAGVPKIILSTRNVNPTHFPYLNIRWFQPWYSFLATIPDILLINNSIAGQCDYAAWMNVTPDRFHVIRNGVDTAGQRVAPHEIAAVRDELHLGPADQLIIGAFRFNEEKRPLMFLDVLEPLMQNRSNLHAAIFGCGPLEPEIQARVRQSAVRSRIQIFSPRPNLTPVYSTSNALLQTSILEGTPNTLLEAQAAGCAVVTTPGGGVEEALLPNQTGFVGRTIEELAHHLANILDNPTLRAQLSSQARYFIESHYGLPRMIDQTVALYTSND